MNVKNFDQKYGKSPYDETLYATASKTEFDSIDDFKNAFLAEHPIYFSENINSPITPHTFCEIRSRIIYGVENFVRPVFEKDIRYALVLAHEWHTHCIVAELDDIYIGYLWETDV